MLGQGRIALHGEIMPAAEALQRLELEPLALGPKEGLALINGTQVSTAIALDALFTGERVFASGLVAGSLSVEALKGTDAAFDPHLPALRGQPGQIPLATVLQHGRAPCRARMCPEVSITMAPESIKKKK